MGNQANDLKKFINVISILSVVSTALAVFFVWKSGSNLQIAQSLALFLGVTFFATQLVIKKPESKVVFSFLGAGFLLLSAILIFIYLINR
jgi:hypothetical protein